MELFILFFIAAVGGFWYYNHLINKRAREQEEQLSKQAPYKVEESTPVKCGCGRSPTGYCVGLHKLTQDEWAVHADNPNKVQPVIASQPVEPVVANEPAQVTVESAPKKKPRKPAAKKSAVSKAVVKKTRSKSASK